MWIRLHQLPGNEPVAVNMSNIWKMESAGQGQTTLHSLGANTGGSSASITVSESIEQILQAVQHDNS